MAGHLESAELRLRSAAQDLDVDDILALCYAFQHQTKRLRLYLDVLRGRGGNRAQFASCLLCYDLARRGDAACQQDFRFLSDTMRELAHDHELVTSLVGNAEYLTFVWEFCSQALEALDTEPEPEPELNMAPEQALEGSLKPSAPALGHTLGQAQSLDQLADEVAQGTNPDQRAAVAQGAAQTSIAEIATHASSSAPVGTEAGQPTAAQAADTVLNLLDEEDVQELDGLAERLDRVDHSQLFDQALNDFLGKSPAQERFDPRAGFRLRSRRDVDRIRRFLRTLDSLRDFVPQAQGYRALVLLFYGSQMRSKNLFGAPNKEKILTMRQGLQAFIEHGHRAWELMGVFNLLHADPEAWPKISDTIARFLGWYHRYLEETTEANSANPSSTVTPLAALRAYDPI